MGGIVSKGPEHRVLFNSNYKWICSLKKNISTFYDWSGLYPIIIWIAFSAFEFFLFLFLFFHHLNFWSKTLICQVVINIDFLKMSIMSGHCLIPAVSAFFPQLLFDPQAYQKNRQIPWRYSPMQYLGLWCKPGMSRVLEHDLPIFAQNPKNKTLTMHALGPWIIPLRK